MAATTLCGGHPEPTSFSAAWADRMEGGENDDVFHIDNSGDVAIEDRLDSLGGVDRVVATVDHTLGGNIENLTLSGSAANGAGNDLGNVIFGNALGNLLDARGGSDRLAGGRASDTLVGGASYDTFDFNGVGDSNTESLDLIRGFDGAGDVLSDTIDVADIDADTTRDGNQSFVFARIDGNQSSLPITKGRLWAVDFGSHTEIQADTDNDATFEFALRISDGSTRSLDYGATNFVL